MHIIENPLDGSAEIKLLRAENGAPITDVRCPVGCGDCCKYWVEIRELQHFVVGVSIRKKKCPALRKYGCRLKRSKMPPVCRGYLCELGMLAYLGLVTKEEISQAVAAHAQDRAAQELKKVFPVEMRDTVRGAMSLDELRSKIREYL